MFKLGQTKDFISCFRSVTLLHSEYIDSLYLYSLGGYSSYVKHMNTGFNVYLTANLKNLNTLNMMLINICRIYEKNLGWINLWSRM